MTIDLDPSIFDDPKQLLGSQNPDYYSQNLDYYSKQDWIKLPLAIAIYKEYYYYANPGEDLDWDTYLILLSFAPVIVTRLVERYLPNTLDEKKVLKAFCHKYQAKAKWIECLSVNVDQAKQHLLRNNVDYQSYEVIAEESIAFFYLSQKLFEDNQIEQNVPPVELCWDRELQNCYLSLQESGLIDVASPTQINKDDYYQSQKELAKLLQGTPDDSTARHRMDVEEYIISTAYEYAQQNSEFKWSKIYQNYTKVRKRVGRNFRINSNLQELKLKEGKLQPNGRNRPRNPRIVFPKR